MNLIDTSRAMMHRQTELQAMLMAAVPMVAALMGGCQLTPVMKPESVQPDTTVPADNTINADRPEPPAVVPEKFSLQNSGSVESNLASEMSGLAVSNRSPNLLWTINDSGNAASLHALLPTGELLLSVPTTVTNRDWEAMTGFKQQGRAYLLVADSGDNLRVHDSYQLHVFAEPEIDPKAPESAIDPVATMYFQYPDGHHNSEAVAVSETDGTVILVTKSADQPGIYTLPLPTPGTGQSTPEQPVTATRLGTLAILQQSVTDRLLSRLAGVALSQVTGLEINHSGTAAYVLTYRGLYRWTRPDQETSWGTALAQTPELLRRHTLKQAEALGLSRFTGELYFTSERLPAPVWRLVPLFQ